ncbi:MAG: polysaccharide deacetylase family protein [Desulfobacterales bacterium]
MAKSWEIITMEEAAEQIRSGIFKGRAAAITFDDGYRDNFETAMNLLKPKGIPATFFIPVSQTDRGEPYWWDYLHSVIKKNQTAFLKWISDGRFDSIADHIRLESRRMPVSRMAVRYLNTVENAFRTDFLNALQTEFGPYQGERLLMNWEEIRHLHNCGFSVGSHTLSHIPLTDLNPDDAKREIFESGKILSQRIGAPVKGFSYPRGAWNRELAVMAKQAGYEYAVTTVFGSNKPGCDLFALSRRSISDYPDMRSFFAVPMYLLEMTGLLDRFIAKRR